MKGRTQCALPPSLSGPFAQRFGVSNEFSTAPVHHFGALQHQAHQALESLHGLHRLHAGVGLWGSDATLLLTRPHASMDPLVEFLGKRDDHVLLHAIRTPHRQREFPDYKSFMVKLLAQRTGRNVQTAADGKLTPGMIYIAPPDQHVTFQSGEMRLVRSAPVHHLRPSIDVLSCRPPVTALCA